MKFAAMKIHLEPASGNDYVQDKFIGPLWPGKGRHDMPEVTIVYWRDIPAQVIVGKGRRAAKLQLPERFEQAIDRCAMKVGARDADAYLAEWRKAEPYLVEGDAAEVASSEAARLDAEFNKEAIKALIANDGWARRD